MAVEKTAAPSKEKAPVKKKEIIREKDVTPRLYEKYYTQIQKLLAQRLGYKNLLEVPKLEKITINMGVGKAKENKAILEQAVNDLALISGQKPIITKARKSIAGFKIKRGAEIGVKVTLRRKRMYEFLDRVLATAIPRIRDFKGFTTASFDETGNFSFGIHDHTVFPEVDISKAQFSLGMDITLSIICKKKADAIELLREFGFPFIDTR